jgi:hypothetical protein
MRLKSFVSVAVLAGFWILSVGSAGAEPTTPTPPPSIAPAPTSSTDELTDMVMDALEGGPSGPSTAPLPLPPS